MNEFYFITILQILTQCILVAKTQHEGRNDDYDDDGYDDILVDGLAQVAKVICVASVIVRKKERENVT